MSLNSSCLHLVAFLLFFLFPFLFHFFPFLFFFFTLPDYHLLNLLWIEKGRLFYYLSLSLSLSLSLFHWITIFFFRLGPENTIRFLCSTKGICRKNVADFILPKCVLFFFLCALICMACYASSFKHTSKLLFLRVLVFP
jgi:hypothetical protein